MSLAFDSYLNIFSKNLYRSDVLITTLSWALIIAEQFFEDKGNHFIFLLSLPIFYDISLTCNS